jgi:hypothetical protein
VQRILNNWFVKWVLAPVAVLCALGWGYFQINYPTCTFRYKLTAEVMTPEGLKSGSSVVEVSYHTGPRILPDPNPRWDTVQGEAVYVDIGQGKNLFITLGTLYSGRKDVDTDSLIRNGDFDESTDYSALKSALDPIWLPIKVFKLGRRSGHEREMCRRVAKLYGQPAEAISLDNLPTLVTFSALNNPLLAKVVNPSDLAASFGAGYTMTAKIQVTNASISNVMYDTLPWLKSSELQFFSGLARWDFYKFDVPG